MEQERILAYGVSGTGKTYQWMEMALRLWSSGSKAKFRVLDTDKCIKYMLNTNKNFSPLSSERGGPVTVFPVSQWSDYMTALPKLIGDNKPDDWIVLDMADEPWSAVQRYFVDEVWGVDKGNYFLQARKKMEVKIDRVEELREKALEAGKKGASLPRLPKSITPEALKGWIDWPVINALYDDFIIPITKRADCNLYATAKANAITEDDDASLRALYGTNGSRPAGQKNLSHQFHTILLLMPGTNGYYVSTQKDRANRAYFERSQLFSLYLQYLVGQAGW